jgi:membrane fusion protein, heavy metal efflux system
MPRTFIADAAALVLTGAAILTSLFAAGMASGLYFYPKFFAIAQGPVDEHSQSQQVEDPEEEILALTAQAAANLELKLGRVQRDDYWKSILLPAQIVEIPGQSDLAVSAPVTGMVSKVEVLPGQSLKVNQALFEIQLTDEALTDAQSKLLSTLTAQEVKKQELDRLKPLIQTGAVSGIKARELEYELKQLYAEQAVLTQELLGRGLPKSTIDNIIEKRELATALRVYAPGFIKEHQQLGESTGYSVENLNVHPGMAVERGALLCDVAYHAELYVRGKAFEADLGVLNRIAENDWDIAIELLQDERSVGSVPLGTVKLLRVDNHVAETAQTVSFYARLANEVTRKQSESQRDFEQWLFRPGQRIHLRLPVEKWREQLVLPSEAVVVDGPNVIVFAEHLHTHEDDFFARRRAELAKAKAANPEAPAVTPVSSQFEPVQKAIELEPIPVRLLHRDDKKVVIADDGQIKLDMKIAMNNAQALYLAMKMQAASGSGHHHDHEH